MSNDYFASALAEAAAHAESAMSPEIGTSLRRIRLSKSLALFHGLERSCSSEGDTAKLRRQMLAVQCQMIRSLFSNTMSKHDQVDVLYYIGEALDAWTWLHLHPEYQHMASNGLIFEVLSELAIDGQGQTLRQDFLHSYQRQLREVHKRCKEPFFAALLGEISRVILEDCLQKAIELYRSGKWAPALSMLTSKDGEMNVFIELQEKLEGQNFGAWGLTVGADAAYTLRSEYEVQSAMCQGSQLIHFGDLNLKEALNGDPDDLLVRGWLAQDDYRAALQCVVGQDIELEGTVLVRLADFYAKITKIPVTAHQLYLRAIQLAAALQPNQPKGTWYKESTDAVQAYRDALQAEEAKKWEHARKPILEKLSKDIEKLRGATHMDNLGFVKFIFENWPPKTEGGKEPPSNPEDPSTITKKQMLKTIQRYHTDKNNRWGDEWRVMSEEVSKDLTARYNIMKGL